VSTPGLWVFSCDGEQTLAVAPLPPPVVEALVALVALPVADAADVLEPPDPLEPLDPPDELDDPHALTATATATIISTARARTREDKATNVHAAPERSRRGPRAARRATRHRLAARVREPEESVPWRSLE
jgi:hypothetical protein